MRHRGIVALLAALTVVTLAVPAAAGGPNDNGNGNRITSIEHNEWDTTWGMPICVDGERQGSVSVPGVYQWTMTHYAKGDTSRAGYILETAFDASDGSYTYQSLGKEHVNGIDYPPGANAYNGHERRNWYDSHGLYAFSRSAFHLSWNEHGDLKSHYSTLGEFTCVRDTVLP